MSPKCPLENLPKNVILAFDFYPKIQFKFVPLRDLLYLSVRELYFFVPFNNIFRELLALVTLVRCFGTQPFHLISCSDVIRVVAKQVVYLMKAVTLSRDADTHRYCAFSPG